MAKSKKYVLSVEVYKYPYCGRPDKNEDYFSEKICCCTIKIRKKIVRKTKRVFVYVQLIISLGNGLAPTQAIGLPILPNTAAIMKVSDSNVGLPKKAIIAQVIKEMPAEIDFTEREIDQLYNLGIELRNNSLSQEELINKISNLRGGLFIDVVAALVVIGAMIILLTNDWGLAFQPNNVVNPARLTPHVESAREILFGKPKPNRYFCPSSSSSIATKMQPPEGMSHQEYVGLSKLEKWLLPDHLNRDQQIDRRDEGKPLLKITFNQGRFKRKHNPEFGLLYSKSLTPAQIDEQAEKFCTELRKMGCDSETVDWYLDVSYQGHNLYQSINLFNKETNQVAIYIKRPDGENLFLSTMTLTELELKHFNKTNGHVKTEAQLKKEQAFEEISRETGNTDSSPNPVIDSRTVDFDPFKSIIDVNIDKENEL